MAHPDEDGEREADPYDAAGVDRSLVRWSLSLTPTERLEYLQGILDAVASVRRLPNGPR